MAAASATERRTERVRKAMTEDTSELASVLARSFADCPAWEWYLPPESKHRLRRMERFFGALLDRLYLRGDRTCLTTEGRTGAVLWDPPKRWKMGAADNVRLFAAMVPVFRGRLSRPIRGFNLMDARHPEEPHYYLSVLGVAPEARRDGVAADLIQPLLDRCDKGGTPAYLETGQPRSREFFGRNGFEVVEEMKLPGDGPAVWGMWREPA